MSGAKLTPLARRVLCALAPIQPAWALSGRSALFKLSPARQSASELDLSWHGLSQLGSLSQEARGRLTEQGFEVTTIRSEFSFLHLVVAERRQTCTLKLTADPGPPLEPPGKIAVGKLVIAVESPREIFAARLCALLECPDLQDLEDVRALLKHDGAGLERALADAPHKLRGFSPLRLAWALYNFRIPHLELEAENLKLVKEFKKRLILQILSSCFPSPSVS